MRFDDTYPEKEKVDFEKVGVGGVGCCTRVCVCVCVGVCGWVGGWVGGCVCVCVCESPLFIAVVWIDIACVVLVC